MKVKHKNCLDKVCEECFVRRLNETHIAGQASAYESVHLDLLEQAAGLFKRGEDGAARFLRALAQDQKVIGETLRAKQKKIRDGKE